MSDDQNKTPGADADQNKTPGADTLPQNRPAETATEKKGGKAKGRNEKGPLGTCIRAPIVKPSQRRKVSG